MPSPLEVLDMIVQDMEDDVKKWDGAPLTGKTVAAIHGELAATIQALAKILKGHIEESKK